MAEALDNRGGRVTASHRQDNSMCTNSSHLLKTYFLVSITTSILVTLISWCILSDSHMDDVITGFMKERRSNKTIK